MNYILFFVYLALCSFLLTRIRFVKNAGIGTHIIVALFIIKVAVGCVHLVIARQDPSSDTMAYSIHAYDEYQLLLHHPKEYLLNLFQSGYAQPYAGLFHAQNSYWNDLKDNVMEKLISIMDLFSLGHNFVNVILYNFITFFGIIGLFRVFGKVYPGKQNLLIVCCFLLPSLLFFSSGIHKEGLMYAAIGSIIFNTYYALNDTGFSFKRVLYITLNLLFIFVVRNYVFIALVPALFAWILVHSGHYKPLLSFSAIYFIGLIVFFNLGKLSPAMDLPKAVADRRASFVWSTMGNTQLALDSLHPTVTSFIVHTPQAIGHALLRPHFSDSKLSKRVIPFAAELYCYIVLVLAFLFLYRGPNLGLSHEQVTVILCCFFFGMTGFLLIGYIVPNIGAIVRYRAIYFPFVLTPVLCGLHTALIKKGYNKQLSRLFLS